VKAHPDLGPGGRHGATVASGRRGRRRHSNELSRTWRCSAATRPTRARVSARRWSATFSTTVPTLPSPRIRRWRPRPTCRSTSGAGRRRPRRARRRSAPLADVAAAPGALPTAARVATRRVSRRMSNPAARWVKPTMAPGPHRHPSHEAKAHGAERVVDWPAATVQDRSICAGIQSPRLRPMRLSTCL
jgi:hypothetical protein